MLAMMSPLAPMLDAMDMMAAESMLALPAYRLSCDVPRTRMVDDDTYEVCVRAPGVDPRHINIESSNGRLRVRGETETAAHTHFVDYTVALPDDADADAASASAADGLITVTLPKKPVEPPMRIEVTGEAAMDDDEATEPGTRYTLTVVAAGLAPSDLELSVDKGVLTIKGETARTGSRIARTYRLPKDADVTSACATSVDGMLTVTVPKMAEEATRKTIAVEKASGEAAPSAEPEVEDEMAVLV